MTKEEAIKYLQQLYPNGGHCWLDEQRIEAIGMAVKSLQEEPVSDDLEEEIIRYIGFPQEADEDVSTSMIRKAAHHFANWQKEQFEKNRLAACDRQTKEEADREMDFVTSIIENENRQPTFDDAIKYGYHQARKDLELTWEDMHNIVIIEDKLIHELCVKDDTLSSTKDFYQEILKRFKERREL